MGVIVLDGLLVLALLGFFLWLRHTNIYKARRRYGIAPDFQGMVLNATQAKKNEPTLPPAALHGYERPRRRRWSARRRD